MSNRMKIGKNIIKNTETAIYPAAPVIILLLFSLSFQVCTLSDVRNNHHRYPCTNACFEPIYRMFFYYLKNS